MTTQVLLVQGLVLVFTAALWWIARRDLRARVLPPVPAADTADLEQLCATLESLVVSLSQRLEVVEARLPKTKVPKAAVRPVIEPEPIKVVEPDSVVIPEPVAELPVAAPAIVPEPPPETRYAPVYVLLASGLSDAAEIARRTGLGRGEVDLILSLRDRRVL